MCIVVEFLSIKLNFNVDHFNWPVFIVYCFLVRVRVFVRVCVDACVFSFLRVFVFSFINSQPSSNLEQIYWCLRYQRFPVNSGLILHVFRWLFSKSMLVFRERMLRDKIVLQNWQSHLNLKSLAFIENIWVILYRTVCYIINRRRKQKQAAVLVLFIILASWCV